MSNHKVIVVGCGAVGFDAAKIVDQIKKYDTSCIIIDEESKGITINQTLPKPLTLINSSIFYNEDIKCGKQKRRDRRKKKRRKK